MACLVISSGGDCVFTGEFEDALRYLRSHPFADRVCRADGVLLATAVPYSTALLWSMNTDSGSPDRGLGVAWVRGVS